MKNNKVVSDDDKVDDPRRIVVFHPATLSAPPPSFNNYSAQKETEDEAFIILYVNVLNSSLALFEHIDVYLFNDEQSDKTSFHGLIEEKKSHTFNDKLGRTSFIVCSLRKFLASTIVFSNYQPSR